ncbi:MAG TPA: leucine--tRNA ligase [Acidimicrobiales bacterium]|nr:leucine--tRNA ligase [Acidimicrobiales bacterium]
MGVPYDFRDLEARWSARWEADRLYEIDVDHVEDVFFGCVEFPYPSGEGLHVGHVFKYGGVDVLCRKRRMEGRNVFQPMGWDSFGINAENYALRVGRPPAEVIAETTANFKRQLSGVGIGWDWTRELATSDPSYYRWTQWLFLRLHEAGLAYQGDAPVTWCPSCATVLAREQVEAGACERCDTPVEQRRLRQWWLRITAYADRLLEGLEVLDWPERSQRIQREWIGRSEGVDIDFEVDGSSEVLRCFTTRPDTIHGVTFLAVAHDHPLLDVIVPDERRPVIQAFRDQTASREAAGEHGGIDGADTGIVCRHPVSDEPIPVFVASYVVAGYGTGAVMGVPAHDDRDRRFAGVKGLEVVDAGLDAAAAASMVEAGTAIAAVRYRLHDWLVSRQRYWGPPIPIVHCASCGAVPVPDDALPVELPEISSVDEIRPADDGRSPLARFDEWVRTPCPRCGAEARRDTDVLDTFVDSSWYFLRYPSVDVDDRPWDAARTERILPIDFYAGGVEHAARHHLYARFVVKALYDLGEISFDEPFPTMRLGGLIIKDGAKMSKSRGNVVDPDVVVAEHGADVLRCALFFTAPWAVGGDFQLDAITGIERFFTRVWRIFKSRPGPGIDQALIDRAIGSVSRDVDELSHNTAIARLMELVGAMEQGSPSLDDRSVFVRLLAPFAPFLAEELWSREGHAGSVHLAPWPTSSGSAGPSAARLAVQVDGKVRAHIDADAPDVEAAARAAVSEAIDGRIVERVIVVPNRLVNLVTTLGPA